ncbi:MAG: hypothetical protein ABJG41_16695 [Cyclobacteriaceae bacterium]
MIRYQERVLSYLFDHFSFERATEIDKNIISAAGSLRNKPTRGRKEEYLIGAREDFKFILYKEGRHFEVKIVYFIKEEESTVYITNFFPTKMNPIRLQSE